MKRVFVCILFVALALTFLQAAALADVDVNEKNFPDKVFREFVQKYYGDPLTREVIQSTTIFQLNGQVHRVASFKGIEYFTELLELDIPLHPDLKELDLSKNTKLCVVYCFQSGLTNLNISKCTELEEFYCNGNKLDKLDLPQTHKLHILHCYNNNIKSLDMSKLPALRELNCKNNKLTKLDISKNHELKGIFCQDNEISDTKNLEKFLEDSNHYGQALPQRKADPSASEGDLIPDHLVLGKGTKIKASNLLPWGFSGLVEWESDNNAVMKIAGKGKNRSVKAISAGTATLAVAFETGAVQSIPVTVVAKKEAVRAIAGPDNIKLNRGETQPLPLKVKPELAADKQLFWRSSDEKIATVTDGLVTAKSTGTCRVIALSTSGVRKVVKVTVTKNAAIEEVSLVPAEITMKSGDQYTLKAQAAPPDADQTVQWSSKNPKVASVKKGVVVAKKVGQTVITCKFANGEKVTCDVIVTK